MMARIAEEIRDQEGYSTPGRQCPANHVSIRYRTHPKIVAGYLIERDELNGPQPHTQQHHNQQPDSDARCRFPCSLASPQDDQPADSVKPADQQRVVGDLNVTSQHLDSQRQRTHHHIRGRGIRCGALLFLLANDDLNHRQQQRQPGGCRDNHGEDDTDDEKCAQLVDYAAEQPTQPAHA